MIDINTLTLGEVARVEELSVLPISAFSNEDKPKGKALAALAFVWKRRTEPTFTWNDALGLTIEQANEILGIGDDEDEEGEEGDADPSAAQSGGDES